MGEGERSLIIALPVTCHVTPVPMDRSKVPCILINYVLVDFYFDKDQHINIKIYQLHHVSVTTQHQGLVETMIMHTAKKVNILKIKTLIRNVQH